MQKKWVVSPKVTKGFQDKFPEIQPVVLQLLYNRGLTEQERIDEFMNPDWGEDVHDPYLFRDMKKAVSRVYRAIEKKEKIVVHGDYDADGVCSTAVLMTVLEKLGAKADVYIPHRESEGYGLNKETVEILKKGNTDLIITCDCGISNIEEVALAVEKGMDVIVTDHHVPFEKLPDRAAAIINPQVEDDTYPFPSLAGVGVAFKLAQGLLRSHTDNARMNIEEYASLEKWLLDLVAIGTVADMMPLLGENRTLVQYGLIVLNKTRRLGLKKLIDLAGLTFGHLNSLDIGFKIGPRLNAAGRMDHANTAYELLMTENSTEAQKLAQGLNAANHDRQQMTDLVVAEAKEQIGDVGKQRILFAHNKDWPLGIIGLVAGKISDAFYRPTIIMTDVDGGIDGSARSVEDFDIISALRHVSEFFDRYGGHRAACGFVLKDRNKLEDFKNALRGIVEKELAGADLMPCLKIDAEIQLEDVDWELYKDLEKFEPFGEDNPRPLYAADGLTVKGLQPVGQNGQHLRIMASHKTANVHKMIGFCLGSESNGENWCERLRIGDKIDATFEVGVNEWNGSRELQLKIVDLKMAN